MLLTQNLETITGPLGQGGDNHESTKIKKRQGSLDGQRQCFRPKDKVQEQGFHPKTQVAFT